MLSRKFAALSFYSAYWCEVQQIFLFARGNYFPLRLTPSNPGRGVPFPNPEYRNLYRMGFAGVHTQTQYYGHLISVRIYKLLYSKKPVRLKIRTGFLSINYIFPYYISQLFLQAFLYYSAVYGSKAMCLALFTATVS